MTPSADDRRKIQLNWYLLAALLVACVTAWPLISGGGLINTRGGGDSPFLIQRLHQLEQAIWDGHFPVRWMGDAAYGYGYPFFNFYAPLAFYVGFLYRLVGVTTVQAIQLSQLTAFLVAAWGSFGLARRWYRRDWVALVVSAAYTTAPFHLVNVYVRGDSIAEFWAMAFYPLVILATDQLLTTDRNRGRTGINWINGVAWLAIAYGGLVLSHNISAMIFSPFVLLFALCRVAPKFSRGALFSKIIPELGLFFVSILLGVAFSAWFWLPALSEQHLTSIADMTVGYFNYRYNNGVHFRSVDLVQSSFLFDPSLEGLQSFRMGLVQAVVTLLALVGLCWKPVRKRLGWAIWLFMVLGLLIATFMLNPLSLFLWDTLPLLHFTQFPWRFLSVQAFFTAMLSGIPVFALVRAFGRSPHGTQAFRKRPIWLAPALTGLLAVGLVYIGIGKLNLSYLPIPQKDVTAESIAQYEWFTGNIGTTVSAEYLPPAAQPRPVTSAWLTTGERNRVTVLAGQATAELTSRKTTRQQWQVTVDAEEDTNEATLVFPTLLWDGWAVLINGEVGEMTAVPLSGLMQLTLPSGQHEVTFVLERSRIRTIAETISLSALVFIIVIFVTDTRRWQLNHAILITAAVPLTALIVVLLAWATAPPIPTDGPYSQDFAQLGWLHPQEEIAFTTGDQTLVDYRYDKNELSAGEVLQVQLNWQAVDTAAGEWQLDLVDPADNFVDTVFAVATAKGTITEGEQTITIAIPEDTPAGLFTPRLSLNNGDLSLTGSNEPRGQLYLRPIRILPSLTAQTTTSTADLDVQVMDIVQVQPEALRLHLAWQTQQPLAKNLVASFRLTDRNGHEVHGAQQDFQPGFGHRPTTSWQPGQPQFDVMGMQLPQPLPFEEPWTVLVYLYETDTGKIRLFRRLGTLTGATDALVFNPVQTDLTLPADLIPIDAELLANGEPVLALRGYRAQPSEAGIDLTLYWQALTQPTADYTHFVHLSKVGDTTPIAQHDSMPGNNTWATGQLAKGQIIEDRLFLQTPDLESGAYRLTAGMYDTAQENFPRLTLANGDSVIELDILEIDR